MTRSTFSTVHVTKQTSTTSQQLQPITLHQKLTDLFLFVCFSFRKSSCKYDSIMCEFLSYLKICQF